MSGCLLLLPASSPEDWETPCEQRGRRHRESFSLSGKSAEINPFSSCVSFSKISPSTRSRGLFLSISPSFCSPPLQCHILFCSYESSLLGGRGHWRLQAKGGTIRSMISFYSVWGIRLISSHFYLERTSVWRWLFFFL